MGVKFFCIPLPLLREGLLESVCRYHSTQESDVSLTRYICGLYASVDVVKTYAELEHNICYSISKKKAFHKLASKVNREQH